MAHARLRWFATPSTRACLPLRSRGYMAAKLLSRRPLPLPDADRQDDHLDAGELQPALDRERRLVVERTGEHRLALEHELAGEHDRAAEFLLQVVADLLQLLDQVGADGEAVLGVVTHALRQLHVLVQGVTHLLLERAHAIGAP